jgi:Fe-S-cluster containining protein
MTDKWYAEGLRFECQPGCSACCSDHGEYTALYLTEDDTRRLARHLAIEHDQFISRYAEVEEGSLLLRMEQPECPFLEEGRCQVYEARPIQCSTFPFWKENLRSRRTWVKLCEFCPGVDSGPQHEGKAITEQIAKRERRS